MATSVIGSFVQSDTDTLADDLADLTTLEPDVEEADPEDDQQASSSNNVPEIDTNLRPVRTVIYDENTPIDSTQYAAGFSDADGSLKVIKSGQNITLQYSAAQSLKGIDALHYLYSHFGGSVILQLEGDAKNQRAYQWVLNGEDALKFAKLISTYLLLKKREAIRFIEFPMQNLHIIPIIAKNLTTGEELKFDTLKDCKEHFGASLAFKQRDIFVWRDWEIRKSLTDAEIQEIKDKRQAIFEDLRDFKEMPHDEIPLDVKPSDAYFGGFAGKVLYSFAFLSILIIVWLQMGKLCLTHPSVLCNITALTRHHLQFVSYTSEILVGESHKPSLASINGTSIPEQMNMERRSKLI